MDRSKDLLAGKPVTVSFRGDNKLIVKSSDKVISVLTGNLIRNAYSYTDTGRVDVEITGQQLTIKDSGIGMPTEDLENMFKPFHRGQSRQRGGYGVGLTIVKMLSDRFKWPLNIESKVDSGTTIIINFPLYDPEEN